VITAEAFGEAFSEIVIESVLGGDVQAFASIDGATGNVTFNPLLGGGVRAVDAMGNPVTSFGALGTSFSGRFVIDAYTMVPTAFFNNRTLRVRAVSGVGLDAEVGVVDTLMVIPALTRLNVFLNSYALTGAAGVRFGNLGITPTVGDRLRTYSVPENTNVGISTTPAGPIVTVAGGIRYSRWDAATQTFVPMVLPEFPPVQDGFMIFPGQGAVGFSSGAGRFLGFQSVGACLVPTDTIEILGPMTVDFRDMSTLCQGGTSVDFSLFISSESPDHQVILSQMQFYIGTTNVTANLSPSVASLPTVITTIPPLNFTLTIPPALEAFTLRVITPDPRTGTTQTDTVRFSVDMLPTEWGRTPAGNFNIGFFEPETMALPDVTVDEQLGLLAHLRPVDFGSTQQRFFIPFFSDYTVYRIVEGEPQPVSLGVHSSGAFPFNRQVRDEFFVLGRTADGCVFRSDTIYMTSTGTNMNPVESSMWGHRIICGDTIYLRAETSVDVLYWAWFVRLSDGGIGTPATAPNNNRIPVFSLGVDGSILELSAGSANEHRIFGTTAGVGGFGAPGAGQLLGRLEATSSLSFTINAANASLQPFIGSNFTGLVIEIDSTSSRRWSTLRIFPRDDAQGRESMDALLDIIGTWGDTHTQAAGGRFFALGGLATGIPNVGDAGITALQAGPAIIGGTPTGVATGISAITYDQRIPYVGLGSATHVTGMEERLVPSVGLAGTVAGAATQDPVNRDTAIEEGGSVMLSTFERKIAGAAGVGVNASSWFGPDGNLTLALYNADVPAEAGTFGAFWQESIDGRTTWSDISGPHTMAGGAIGTVNSINTITRDITAPETFFRIQYRFVNAPTCMPRTGGVTRVELATGERIGTIATAPNVCGLGAVTLTPSGAGQIAQHSYYFRVAPSPTWLPLSVDRPGSPSAFVFNLADHFSPGELSDGAVIEVRMRGLGSVNFAWLTEEATTSFIFNALPVIGAVSHDAEVCVPVLPGTASVLVTAARDVVGDTWTWSSGQGSFSGTGRSVTFVPNRPGAAAGALQTISVQVTTAEGCVASTTTTLRAYATPEVTLTPSAESLCWAESGAVAALSVLPGGGGQHNLSWSTVGGAGTMPPGFTGGTFGINKASCTSEDGLPATTFRVDVTRGLAGPACPAFATAVVTVLDNSGDCYAYEPHLDFQMGFDGSCGNTWLQEYFHDEGLQMVFSRGGANSEDLSPFLPFGFELVHRHATGDSVVTAARLDGPYIVIDYPWFASIRSRPGNADLDLVFTFRVRELCDLWSNELTFTYYRCLASPVNVNVVGDVSRCDESFTSIDITLRSETQAIINLGLLIAPGDTVAFTGLTGATYGTGIALSPALAMATTHTITIPASNFPVGTHTIIACNAMECGTATFTVRARPVLTSIENLAVCQNGALNWVVDPPAGATLSFFSNAAGTTPATPSNATPGGPFDFFVSRIADGCTSAIHPVQLTVHPNVPSTIAVNSTGAITPLCQGATSGGTLAITTDVTGFNIRWESDFTTVGTFVEIPGQTSTTLDITGAMLADATTAPRTTQFRAVVYSTTTPACGEVSSSPVSIVVNPPPATPTITPVATVCENLSGVTFSLSSALPAGATVTWSLGTWSEPGAANATTSPEVPAAQLVAGERTVSAVVNHGGCLSDPGTMTFDVIPNSLPLTLSLGRINLCNGDTTRINLSRPLLLTETINWVTLPGTVTPQGTVVPGGYTNLDTDFFVFTLSSVVAGPNYILMNVSNNGCPAMPLQASVACTVMAQPNQSHVLQPTGGTTPVCYGTAPGQISAMVYTPAFGNSVTSVQWQSSTDGTNFTNIPGAVSTTGGLSYHTPGNLYQTTWFRTVATFGCGGPVSSEARQIIVDDPPTAPTISGVSATHCQNAVVTASIATVSGGVVEWTLNGAVQAGQVGFTFTVPTAAATADQTLVARVRVGDCWSGPSATVNFSILPASAGIVLTRVTPAAICVGDSIVITSDRPLLVGSGEEFSSLTWIPATAVPDVTEAHGAGTRFIFRNITTAADIPTGLTAVPTNLCPPTAAVTGTIATTLVQLPNAPTAVSGDAVCYLGTDITTVLRATRSGTPLPTIFFYAPTPIPGVTIPTAGATAPTTVTVAIDGSVDPGTFNFNAFAQVTTGGATCRSASVPGTFVIHPRPAALTIASVATPVCAGSTGNPITLAAAAAAGHTLTWTITGGATPTGSGTDFVFTAGATATTTGSVSVAQISEHTCTSAFSTPEAFVVHAQGTAPTLTLDGATAVNRCPGAVMPTLAVTGGTIPNASNFILSGGGLEEEGTVLADVLTAFNALTTTVTATTTFTLRIEQHACADLTATATVTMVAAPTEPIISAITQACVGQPLVVNAASTGATAIRIYRIHGADSVLAGIINAASGSINVATTALTPGVHNFRAVATNGTCETMGATAVPGTVVAIPTLVAPNLPTECLFNPVTFTVTSTDPAAATLTWWIDGVQVGTGTLGDTMISGNTLTIPAGWASAATPSLTVTARATYDGCFGTADITATSTCPVPSVSITTLDDICINRDDFTVIGNYGMGYIRIGLTSNDGRGIRQLRIMPGDGIFTIDTVPNTPTTGPPLTIDIPVSFFTANPVADILHTIVVYGIGVPDAMGQTTTTVRQVPAAPSVGSFPETICQGADEILLNRMITGLPANRVYTFMGAITPGLTIPTSFPGTATVFPVTDPDLLPADTFRFYVSYTSVHRCLSHRDTGWFEVRTTNFNIPELNEPAAVCLNTATTITFVDANPFTSANLGLGTVPVVAGDVELVWSPATGFTGATGGTQATPTRQQTFTSAGEFDVSFTMTVRGCARAVSSQSNEVTAVVYQTPVAATIATGASNNICLGGIMNPLQFAAGTGATGGMRYVLERSTDGGSWTTIYPAPGGDSTIAAINTWLAEPANRTLSVLGSHRIRVRTFSGVCPQTDATASPLITVNVVAQPQIGTLTATRTEEGIHGDFAGQYFQLGGLSNVTGITWFHCVNATAFVDPCNFPGDATWTTGTMTEVMASTLMTNLPNAAGFYTVRARAIRAITGASIAHGCDTLFSNAVDIRIMLDAVWGDADLAVTPSAVCSGGSATATLTRNTGQFDYIIWSYSTMASPDQNVEAHWTRIDSISMDDWTNDDPVLAYDQLVRDNITNTTTLPTYFHIRVTVGIEGSVALPAREAVSVRVYPHSVGGNVTTAAATTICYNTNFAGPITLANAVGAQRNWFVAVGNNPATALGGALDATTPPAGLAPYLTNIRDTVRIWTEVTSGTGTGVCPPANSDTLTIRLHPPAVISQDLVFNRPNIVNGNLLAGDTVLHVCLITATNVQNHAYSIVGATGANLRFYWYHSISTGADIWGPWVQCDNGNVATHYFNPPTITAPATRATKRYRVIVRSNDCVYSADTSRILVAHWYAQINPTVTLYEGATAITGTGPVCSGTDITAVVGIPNWNAADLTINWTLNGAPETGTSNNTVLTRELTTLVDGNQTFLAQVSNNVCHAVDAPATIQVLAEPVAVPITATPNEICVGTSTVFARQDGGTPAPTAFWLFVGTVAAEATTTTPLTAAANWAPLTNFVGTAADVATGETRLRAPADVAELYADRFVRGQFGASGVTCDPTFSAPVTVRVYATPTLTATVATTTHVCIDQTTVQVSLPAGATARGNWVWQVQGTGVPPWTDVTPEVSGTGTVGALTVSATDLGVGTHTFRVLVTNGVCAATPNSANRVVEVWDVVTPGTIVPGDTMICQSQSVVFAVTGNDIGLNTGTINAEWTVTPSVGTFVTASSPTSATISFGTEPSYTVSLELWNAGCTTRVAVTTPATVTTTVAPAIPTLAVSPAVICVNSDITLTVTRTTAVGDSIRIAGIPGRDTVVAWSDATPAGADAVTFTMPAIGAITPSGGQHNVTARLELAIGGTCANGDASLAAPLVVNDSARPGVFTWNNPVETTREVMLGAYSGAMTIGGHTGTPTNLYFVPFAADVASPEHHITWSAGLAASGVPTTTGPTTFVGYDSVRFHLSVQSEGCPTVYTEWITLLLSPAEGVNITASPVCVDQTINITFFSANDEVLTDPTNTDHTLTGTLYREVWADAARTGTPLVPRDGVAEFITEIYPHFGATAPFVFPSEPATVGGVYHFYIFVYTILGQPDSSSVMVRIDAASIAGEIQSGGSTVRDTVCQGYPPQFILNDVAATGGVLGNTITWQFSSGAAGPWTTASGTLSNENRQFAPTVGSAANIGHYRALIQNGVCPPDSTNVIHLHIILDEPLGAITGDQILCINNTGVLLNMAPSGQPEDFVWQRGPSATGPWTTIALPGATPLTYAGDSPFFGREFFRTLGLAGGGECIPRVSNVIEVQSYDSLVWLAGNAPRQTSSTGDITLEGRAGTQGVVSGVLPLQPQHIVYRWQIDENYPSTWRDVVGGDAPDLTLTVVDGALILTVAEQFANDNEDARYRLIATWTSPTGARCETVIISPPIEITQDLEFDENFVIPHIPIDSTFTFNPDVAITGAPDTWTWTWIDGSGVEHPLVDGQPAPWDPSATITIDNTTGEITVVGHPNLQDTDLGLCISAAGMGDPVCHPFPINVIRIPVLAVNDVTVCIDGVANFTLTDERGYAIDWDLFDIVWEFAGAAIAGEDASTLTLDGAPHTNVPNTFVVGATVVPNVPLTNPVDPISEDGELIVVPNFVVGSLPLTLDICMPLGGPAQQQPLSASVTNDGAFAHVENGVNFRWFDGANNQVGTGPILQAPTNTQARTASRYQFEAFNAWCAPVRSNFTDIVPIGFDAAGMSRTVDVDGVVAVADRFRLCTDDGETAEVVYTANFTLLDDTHDGLVSFEWRIERGAGGTMEDLPETTSTLTQIVPYDLQLGDIVHLSIILGTCDVLTFTDTIAFHCPTLQLDSIMVTIISERRAESDVVWRDVVLRDEDQDGVFTGDENQTPIGPNGRLNVCVDHILYFQPMFSGYDGSLDDLNLTFEWVVTPPTTYYVGDFTGQTEGAEPFTDPLIGFRVVDTDVMTFTLRVSIDGTVVQTATVEAEVRPTSHMAMHVAPTMFERSYFENQVINFMMAPGRFQSYEFWRFIGERDELDLVDLRNNGWRLLDGRRIGVAGDNPNVQTSPMFSTRFPAGTLVNLGVLRHEQMGIEGLSLNTPITVVGVAIDNYGCEAVSDITIRLIPVPTVLVTEGPSEANRVLFPNFDVEVFNTWGIRMQSFGEARGWDPRFRGRDIHSGTYYYNARIPTPEGYITISGAITIIREE